MRRVRAAAGMYLHLSGYDKQHSSHSSKCCWGPQLYRKEDEDADQLQRSTPQKHPEGHGIIKSPDVI